MQGSAEVRFQLLFGSVRRTSWGVIAAYVWMHTVLLFVFFSRTFLHEVSRPLYYLSGGWLTHTLLTNLVELVLLVGMLMLVIGRLRPQDVGLARSKIVNATVVVLLFWAAIQGVTVFIGIVDDGMLIPNPDILEQQGDLLLIQFLEMLFGPALVEEIAYRGFLMPQLYLKLQKRLPHRPRTRLALAVLLPQIYFGLNHVPAGLSMRLSSVELTLYIVNIILVGIFFAAFYLRTDNLFVVVGVHALFNYPASLFVTRVDPGLITLVLGFVLLLAWPTLARSLHKVFTLGPLWLGERSLSQSGPTGS